MHRTYELHVRVAAGHRRFHVVTCPAEQIMQRAREALDDGEAEEVEVREAGQHLFTLGK